MYSQGGWIMIIGVVLSLGFICLMVWYVNRQIGSNLTEKKWLTRYVALLLTALLGLFIVDKLVSFDTKLLSDEMSHSLFELIQSIVLVIFGYQFSANSKKENE
jgi:prepilin signal peptidase PulO-like enzyme (type II secretory pathway)